MGLGLAAGCIMWLAWQGPDLGCLCLARLSLLGIASLNWCDQLLRPFLMQGQEAEEADRRGRRHGEARGAVQGARLFRFFGFLRLAVLAVSRAGVQLTRCEQECSMLQAGHAQNLTQPVTWARSSTCRTVFPFCRVHPGSQPLDCPTTPCRLETCRPPSCASRWM